MNTTTVNISLPTSLYVDMKKTVSKRGYTSVSELIREAVRNWLYPHTTVNGFTPAFENQVLTSAKTPLKKDIVLRSDKEISNYFGKLIKPRKLQKKSS